MRQLKGFARSVAVVAGASAPAAMIALGGGAAVAAPPEQPDPNGADRVELGATTRDCSFNPVGDPAASTTAAMRPRPRTDQGSGFAIIGTTLNQVIAEVHLTNAVPNAADNVRLIELPSSTCAPGAPGVAVGTLQTDAAGNGILDLRIDVIPGATGAWVAVLDESGQVYTSNTVAPVNTGHKPDVTSHN
jgi:hypothetical protein